MRGTSRGRVLAGRRCVRRRYLGRHEFLGRGGPELVGGSRDGGRDRRGGVLAWQERRRAEKAEQERDDLRHEITSGVASRVAGRMELTPRKEPSGPRRFGDTHRESWRAVVKNGSDQAVTNVKGYAVHSDGGVYDLLGSWPVIPPEETVYADEEVSVRGYNETPYFLLVFTDPEGRRWSRGQDVRAVVVQDDEWPPTSPR